MSDGTATRRRGLTKTHKRLLGAAGSIAVVVLVFVFVLPEIATTGTSWTSCATWTGRTGPCSREPWC